MSDEVLLVTGGASGIGRAVVRLAAQRHWRVCIIDRDGAALESAAAEALEHGADKVWATQCDVSSEASMEVCFDAAEEQLGPLSGLFTSAGIERRGFAHETPYETWQHVIETNLNGTFLACQLALRSLLRSKIPGSLVCCSSPASFVAYSAGAASSYSASKGGVSALVRTLAVDYAQYGIRVNAVVPGATETPLMWANSDESEKDRLRELIRSEVPLGRLAEPEEPAEAVMWLLSPKAGYVTGSHLVCDGGILAKASISF
jgi:NAD(P)-dependent dehydrogenase (short-subunit alcohol dehydrogenase family)